MSNFTKEEEEMIELGVKNGFQRWQVEEHISRRK